MHSFKSLSFARRKFIFRGRAEGSQLSKLFKIVIMCLYFLSLSLEHCWPSLGVLNNLHIPDEELEKMSVNFNVTKMKRGNCVF